MALGALSHIAFTVADLDRSAAFYDRVLGFLGYERWPAVDGQAKWKKQPQYLMDKLGQVLE